MDLKDFWNHILMLRYPRLSIPYILNKVGIHNMDDEAYLKYIYAFRNKGAILDLEHPSTYQEKLNWIKLHDRNPIYTTMADKIAVKKYVADIIGKEYIIPIIRGGVYRHFSEIDIKRLPDQFVLKCNHDSGCVFICTDKNKFDFQKAREELERRLRVNYGKLGVEWPYMNVPRRILCEKYIENLADHNYKFFCFDGKMKAVYVAPYREATVDYFDPNYKHLDIVTRLHQCAAVPPAKPKSFEKMKSLAEKISKGYPQMRVDFYDVDGKIYFGEITFFHEAGFVPFIPDKWNRIFGNWVKLPV